MMLFFSSAIKKIFPHQILTHTWTWSETILSVAAESRSTSSLSSYKKSLNFSFIIVQLEHSVNNQWRFDFHLPGWVTLRALQWLPCPPRLPLPYPWTWLKFHNLFIQVELKLQHCFRNLNHFVLSSSPHEVKVTVGSDKLQIHV